MVEMYSLNIDVAENGSIPFNSVKVLKGSSVMHTAPATVQFNKRGVYMVQVEASATPAAAGDVSIQLAKNGVLDQSAYSITTGAADETTTLGFTTLVQVRQDNTCCCVTSPTTIQIINTGLAVTFPIVRIIVTKIC